MASKHINSGYGGMEKKCQSKQFRRVKADCGGIRAKRCCGTIWGKVSSGTGMPGSALKAAGLALMMGAGLIVTMRVHAAQEPEGGFFGDYYTPTQGTESQGQETSIMYMPEDYDVTYSGMLDQYTGDVPEVQEGVDGNGSDLVYMITEDMGFDAGSRQYVNYVRGDKSKYYYSSLPKGIVTNGSISFQMGSRNQYALYCDGERVTDMDVSNIVQEGSYVLETYGQGSSDAERFEFTIIQSLTNTIEQFTIPDGFRFSGVMVNGEQAAVPSGTVFQMSSDGNYRFEFGCGEIGMSYLVQVEKDTVAPILSFTGVIDGIAKGPVTILKEDENAILEVSKDGAAINVPYTHVLEDYGDYVVTVRDMAGNSNEYRFTIQLSFTMMSMMVFLLLIVIVAGLFGYYRYVKTHLRVR